MVLSEEGWPKREVLPRIPAEAVLVQSRALTALMTHLSQGVGSASPASSVSTRETSCRLELQAELAQRDGSFYRRVLTAAACGVLERQQSSSGYYG